MFAFSTVLKGRRPTSFFNAYSLPCIAELHCMSPIGSPNRTVLYRKVSKIDRSLCLLPKRRDAR